MNLNILGNGLECIRDLNTLLAEAHSMRSDPVHEDNEPTCSILEKICDMALDVIHKIEYLDFKDCGSEELENYIAIAMNFMQLSSLIISRINGEAECLPKKRGRRTKSR